MEGGEMSDDLVKRLREVDAHEAPTHAEVDMAEAAARIEALTAERDGLLRCVTDNHVALCRAENAEAERDRLRAKLADAAVALDAAGMELSDFANCLSREPWAACLAYEAAIDARAALKGETP
jgi:hypothetical protein